MTTNPKKHISTSTNTAATEANAPQPANGRKSPAKYSSTGDLANVTITAAIEAAAKMWPENGGMGLVPGKPTKALARLADIAAWAKSNDYQQLSELSGDVANQMLSSIVGVPDVTHLKTAKDSKKLTKAHIYRNTLIALRGTALLALHGHNRSRAQRPKGDSLAENLPTLQRRTLHGRRPLFDDEILLARTQAQIEIKEGAEPRTVAAYLLAESGVRHMESTRATTAHLDDRAKPTKIETTGVWDFGTHKVPFDPFVARALEQVLATLDPGIQRLTYDGKHPGTKEGCASLTPVITKFLRRAGIDSPDVTALSACMWRSRRLVNKGKFAKARKIHGGKTRNMLADLKLTHDERYLKNGQIGLLDTATRELVALVTAAEFYDGF